MKKLDLLAVVTAILIIAFTLSCGDDESPACVDSDGDTYGQNCSAGPDECDDDTNNWTAAGCADCTDLDVDTWFIDCDRYQTINGPDCDDNIINVWSVCTDCVDREGDDWGIGTTCDATEDCDDIDDSIYPDAPEICDGIDNQCPGDAGYGTVDEGYAILCDMAQIPAGCFDMGDHFEEGNSNELPVHNVCLSGFKMDVHEVANAEYKACVDASVCSAPSDSSSYSRGSYYGNPTYDDYPVIWVSWNDATTYCTWLGNRLPTEAEWEYAARGGLSGKRYPWGDAIGGSDANYWNSGDPWDNDTNPVEYYPANGYGLYDMAGNVYEWVNDWYQSDYYSVSLTNDPPGPTSGTIRVLRGGSWYVNNLLFLRVAVRGSFSDNPSYRSNSVGFRCASSGD